MAEGAAASSRDKILDVAEALFARRGFAGVGMREVASAVGLGKSSLFHHFRSKGQLYYEVLGRVLARIGERLAPALRREGAAADRLQRWVETLIDALAEHPTSARLLLRALVEEEEVAPEALPPEALAAERTLEALLDGVRGLLREGIERGELRDVSAAHTLQTLIGATVYHFASGELGAGVIGAPLFSAEAVRRRKSEIAALLRQGLAPVQERHGNASGGTSAWTS
jgi:AcrR family transcriptional regulator